MQWGNMTLIYRLHESLWFH